MTKKQLKILIESRFDALLLEQEEEDMEWAGLPYKEVAAKLKAYGVKSLKGAWWKKFSRNSEVRKKYRNWYKNRGKVKRDNADNKWRKVKGTERWEKIGKGEKTPPSLKTSGDTDQYGNLMSPTNFDKADDKNAFKLYVQAAKNRKKYQYPAGVPTHEPIFLNPKHPYFGLTSGEVAYIRGNKEAGDPPSRKYEIGVAIEPNKEKSEAMVRGWIAKHSKKPGEQKTSSEKKPESQEGIDTPHGRLTSPGAIAAYEKKFKKDVDKDGKISSVKDISKKEPASQQDSDNLPDETERADAGVRRVWFNHLYNNNLALLIKSPNDAQLKRNIASQLGRAANASAITRADAFEIQRLITSGDLRGARRALRKATK